LCLFPISKYKEKDGSDAIQEWGQNGEKRAQWHQVKPFTIVD
jgi:hypothetical protein